MVLSASDNNTAFIAISQEHDGITNMTASTYEYTTAMSNNPTTKDPLWYDSYYENVWNKPEINAMNMMCLPVIIIMGVIGNGFTLLIMTRKSMRNQGFCFYLATLAVSDTVQLCTYGAWYLVYATTGSVVDVSVFAHCKLDYFLDTYSHQYSAWVLVAVAVERYISIYFPYKTKTLCTVRNAKLVCCGLLVCLFLICSPNLLPQSREVTKWGPFYWCVPVKNSSLYYFITKIWPILDVVMYGIFPSALMIILNMAIVFKIRKNKRISNISSSYSKKSRQLTITLLVVSTAYMVLSLPHGFFVVYIEQDYQNKLHMYTTSKLFTVFNLCNFLNHSINFVLYCLSGDKFRMELVKMLCPKVEVVSDWDSVAPKLSSVSPAD